VNKCREQAGESPIQLSEGNEGPGNPKGLPDNQSPPDGVRPLTPADIRVEKSVVLGVKWTEERPLTPAAKQKAYRERLKADPVAHDAYREANKLRMKKKRNGQV
jgi:hypothetical protein